MVQNFDFRRNNNSAVCLEDENWRPQGTRYNERFTQQTMKHTTSVMIWGAISTQGTAGLFFLDPGTTMNGKKYLELMNEK